MTIKTNDLPALVVSFVALIVAAVGAIASFYFSYRTDKSKVLFEVFTEFRCKKCTDTRILLSKTIVTGPDMDFEPFRDYSYFLNHIGMLLDKSYIDIDAIYQMAGNSIIDTWRILGPKILSVREESAHLKYFQFHFQYLAAELLEYRAQGRGNEIIRTLIAESNEKMREYPI